ncbi:MAG: 23S rRNA (pseudouridine(1915)-N(3))-methyltransferase RlmH [Deltaproteobacteria bacterium]|nr:23S rRNA (pseudouridine(1915)-N(3))-methyltransferase RlmH [Deltaproteobacteria bacterium]
MKLRIVAVGRDRGDELCQIADRYVTRLNKVQSVEVVEVKEEPASRNKPVAQVRRLEAERIRKVLTRDERVVALDERGRQMTSESLASTLGTWRDDGVSIVSFVIGGPNGLDPAFVESAFLVWSLSKLTLPHRLARVVVAEQIYRAWTILRKEPYHK